MEWRIDVECLGKVIIEIVGRREERLKDKVKELDFEIVIVLRIG